MHKNYMTSAIRQLRDQQVRFAPRKKKLEQVDRAERLLIELDPTRTYTYEYLCFRITTYRPEDHPDLRVIGREASHDLRLFVEDVSDAANISANAAGQQVLSIEDLSERFNVSTKTISRWRRQGLVSRRFSFGGRKRVGFLRSSVDLFVKQNQERVHRGARFSQMTDDERELIVHRARRLARAGACPADVAKRLSRKTGRSAETIRYTLKQFDQEHPDLAIFPDRNGPLRDDAKHQIFRQCRRGESVESMAKRFRCTKANIYRIVSEMRVRAIIELPLDYMPNEMFGRVRSEKTILGQMPESDQPARKTRLPKGLPPYLMSLYDVPLLTREQEVHLFRKMNYLKYKAGKLRQKLDPTRPRVELMGRIEELYEQAVSVKNEIVRANLRLVVSIAKRHVGPTADFFELVSDGNVSLIRAAEKFDFARGNKFSTYASWAVMKNFARSIPGEHKQHDRFRTSQSEVFLVAEDERADQYEQESAQLLREFQVEKILGRLDEREQRIIIKRFGLARGQEPRTLKEVGVELGVTKERIRQIESRALDKLRKAAQEDRIEVPEIE